MVLTYMESSKSSHDYTILSLALLIFSASIDSEIN